MAAGGGSACEASQGYLRVASRVARVRFRPAPGIFASSLVSSRRLCALPSKPPQSAATCASADSPLWPNGGWPRSCARQAASTRSGSQPSAAPSSLPIWAHSSEWVSLVRGKSAWPTSTTCVFAASLRSAELCSTLALSRWNGLRSWLRARLAGSAANRSVACPSYAASAGHLLSLPPVSSSATARPASSRATGTRNGEQET